MSASAHVAPVAVIGLGNLLERDDGFGPRVVQWLERHVRVPCDVELIDMGTGGLHLVGHVVGRRTVIFVDAVTAGGTPGELRAFDRAALLGGRASGPRFSPHQADVAEVLAIAEVCGDAPRDVLLIGAEPVDLADGLGLSPALQGSVVPAARRVVGELARRGFDCAWECDATIGEAAC